MWIQHIELLLIAVWPVVPLYARPLAAQEVEQRLARLERQVVELRRIHDLPADPVIELPAELVGNEHVKWGYPGGTCVFLVREHYVVCHDGDKRIPEWVTYHLTTENLEGDLARTDNFRADPDLVPDERAEPNDYKNSGYDRGHMAPAAAFKRSAAAMSQTFLMSNMTPQRPSLNRRIWRQLEDQVRTLAETHGSIWVFTGSLFLDDAGNPVQPTAFVGANRVAVPTHLYKVILCEHDTDTIELFAFIVPNQLQPISGSPEAFLVSVDSVEAVSRLDFFTALPDADEDRLEATVATTWPLPQE
jgi:DNA/RNA endonuclease G (NUC1)